MKKTVLSLSLALLNVGLLANANATTVASDHVNCSAPEGRFVTTNFEANGKDFHIIEDKYTQLEWMKCPLGMSMQDGNCVGEKVVGKSADAMAAIETHVADFGEYAEGWRLPTAQELLTISNQSCRYGTYTDVFNFSVTYQNLKEFLDGVAYYKAQLDVLWDEHAVALKALEEVRANDENIEAKIQEWVDAKIKLKDYSNYDYELAKKLYREMQPWLMENVPEFKAVRIAMTTFSNANRGNEEKGVESLVQYYRDYDFHDRIQSFTGSNSNISFVAEPGLGVGNDDFFNIFYTYRQSTMSAPSDWGSNQIRLVRDITESVE